MGCATSKPKVCHNCQAPYSPVRRSYSVQVNHHHHHHVVALTSSTLGSLNLDPGDPYNKPRDDRPPPIQISAGDGESDAGGGSERKITPKEEFEMGMIEAKTWSLRINDRIPKITPKTPVQTPPGEPETINAWEMMEGLEDISPLRPTARHFRSFSFHVPSCSGEDQPTPRVRDNRDDLPETKPDSPNPPDTDSNSNSNSNSNDTSIVSEFDPDVIATFRKALEELPPANPFHLKPAATTNKVTPCGERVIVYFTSLRGVRKTYEDCCHVRVVLKGLGIRVDERDVSLHSGFKDELKELLSGEGLVGGVGSLPRVFIGKRYIGGADEVRRLNEEGKLEKLVEGCDVVEDRGEGQNGLFCEACGDIRFVPCETCSGSCKVYYEGDYEEEGEFDECGFHRCPDCNENGLVRCPICFD
ncbi:Uncharacterized protein SHERM_24126 [Striga hermonthica]|uniref:Glutaredoxin domain-containing protein n=1 Tax=Striga hermonthica TaxID=68872 RepID=A0A9N7NGP3_STRHE|nr:Uncharacterized protein SHERM_24126 [Striga hermonthica]